MGKSWNYIRGTIQQMFWRLLQLMLLAAIVLAVYFVWVNFIKSAQDTVDKKTQEQEQRLEHRQEHRAQRNNSPPGVKPSSLSGR